MQEQIPSEVSGVAFSLNPQNNCYDEAVINANFGLGETVVNGHVTPDTYVVEKVRGEILERSVAAKSHAAWLVNGGGTEERDNAEPEAPSLTDEQALAVAQLAADAEAHYGAPMDIEWAIHDHTLYLLQSRPITAYVPLPAEMITEPGAQKNPYLDLIVLTQGFGDCLSVLGAKLWGRMLVLLKGEIMIDAGVTGTLINMDGRQYLNLSSLQRALGASMMDRLIATYDTPTRKILESVDFEAEYRRKELPEALKGARWNLVKMGLKVLPSVVKGFVNLEKALREYDDLFERDLARCRALAREEMPFDEMQEALLALFGNQLSSMGVVALPVAARPRVAKVFRDDPEAQELLVALEMDLPGNPTAEMGRRMFELASFEELQATADGDAFEAKIRARSYSAEFLSAYDAYMERFGCRGIKEIDIATPRAYDNLPAFFDQLRAIDLGRDAIAAAERRRVDAHERLFELARARGKEKQVRKLAHTIRSAAGYREAPKFFFIQLVALLRGRALTLADRLVAAGRMDDPQHVFDLTPFQLGEAERDAEFDVRAAIERNLSRRRHLDRVRDWPRVIDSRGKIPRPPLSETEDGLVGDAIAPGTVRGRAKVLHAPYEKPLEEGDILVTRASDPGWTPIFVNAAGVVLEVGGPLQHGAVIAREYGLPCVSGIDGVVELIEDGQMIEVDGSAGVVRILDEAA